MRAIDADAVIKAIDKHTFETDDGLCLDDDITCILEDVPTIEPKKGEWIPITKGERGYSAGDFRCSVCHQPNKCYIVTNYCSHCGADMRDK